MNALNNIVSLLSRKLRLQGINIYIKKMDANDMLPSRHWNSRSMQLK